MKATIHTAPGDFFGAEVVLSAADVVAARDR